MEKELHPPAITPWEIPLLLLEGNLVDKALGRWK